MTSIRVHTMALAAALALLAGAATAGPMHDTEQLTGSLPTWLADSNSGSVPLGFQINFGGDWYASINVASEGILTWGAFTSDLPDFPAMSIIAPYYANADLRAGGTVRYGQATIDGHRAFGASWLDVAGQGQAPERRNSFQVWLVDRSDRALGDFDLEFNYDTLGWDDASGEAPGARAGWQTRHWNSQTWVTLRDELPGSGVAGALLDDVADTGLVHGHRGSPVDGRYVWSVQGGLPVAAVPEPSALWLAGLGLGALGLARRRSARP